MFKYFKIILIDIKFYFQICIPVISKRKVLNIRFFFSFLQLWYKFIVMYFFKSLATLKYYKENQEPLMIFEVVKTVIHKSIVDRFKMTYCLGTEQKTKNYLGKSADVLSAIVILICTTPCVHTQ